MKQRSRLRMLTVLVAGSGLFASTAQAHHAVGSVVDTSTEDTVRGEVARFEWTNPHSFIWLSVENPDGTRATWAFEGMSPNYLGRRGWTKNSIKPGDQVEVVFWPWKSEEPGGFPVRLTLEDGTELIQIQR